MDTTPSASPYKKVLLVAGLVVVAAGYGIWVRFGSSPTPVATTPPTTTPVTTPTPEPTPVTTPPVAVAGTYKDGSYAGTVANTVYGDVQVKAIISGGKISDITILQSPTDRGESAQISQRSLPILVKEAIAAQIAEVSTVSGATQTSEGFSQSLSSALALAKN